MRDDRVSQGHKSLPISIVHKINMNLEPSSWGPHFWNTFHFIAAAYDNNPNQSVQSAMKNFIQSLPILLPCKECQDNALNFFKTKNLDVVVSTRKELFEFFFDFHNRVNARLNKPILKIEDALKRYHIPKEDYKLYSVEQSPSRHPAFGRVEVIIITIIILCSIMMMQSIHKT